VTTDCSPPLVRRAFDFTDRTALIAPEGRFTYCDLLGRSAAAASILLDGAADLEQARVAFLVPPGFDYVRVQWAVWRAGGIAVPLALSHPRPELEHVIGDADADILICHPDVEDRLGPIAADYGLRCVITDDLDAAAPAPLPSVDPGRGATIMYTSGTTGKAKGVLTTHANLAAQIESMIEAWGWTADDHILHVLPLHHVHGVVNVLGCGLWAGAVCEMLPRFDPEEVWERLAGGEVTLFMAVPTIYNRLIAAWEGYPEARRRELSERSRSLRLMVSGSAALPVSTLERWREITGHVLLERYGMTEFCMALSNPLDGERVAGSVGTPMPGVEVRLVGDDGVPVEDGVPGEIEVRGPGVFPGYWRNPGATASSFREGWFRTGDQAVVERGRYRILGRSSVDIIKSGGEKISALEIEETLRSHGAIADCAVVGVPDPEWGQRVAAALVLAGDTGLTLEELRSWAKERLAAYKVPQEIRIVGELPRNAMGKVFKPHVIKLFE